MWCQQRNGIHFRRSRHSRQRRNSCAHEIIMGSCKEKKTACFITFSAKLKGDQDEKYLYKKLQLQTTYSVENTGYTRSRTQNLVRKQTFYRYLREIFCRLTIFRRNAISSHEVLRE